MTTMTPRERMLTAMRNEMPDRVPVAPDMSNMIPCRLTGKPFWDIYLYQDPPLWRAYMDAVKHFDLDGWLYSLDGFSPYDSDPKEPTRDDGVIRETVIVERDAERIITRAYTQKKGEGKEWSTHVTVYPIADPPTHLLASKVGLGDAPGKWWPIEGVKPQKKGFELLKEGLEYFDSHGVVGAFVGPPQLSGPDVGYGYSIYDYYDRPDEVRQAAVKQTESAIAYLRKVLAGPVRPDFILTGGSGMLVFNTPAIVRELSLPCLQEVTRLCKEAGIPSQIHCCGPERKLVEMCAEETDLSSINPLEIAPMGDCDLADIKVCFGKKIGLMGNLHTTEVMLHGSVSDVRRESLKAIRDAGEGGGFILSTGDQCGRDTPDANIHEMVNVAKEFGTYPLDMAAIEAEIRALERTL